MSREQFRTLRKFLMREVKRAKTQEEKQGAVQALFEHEASHPEFLDGLEEDRECRVIGCSSRAVCSWCWRCVAHCSCASSEEEIR